MPDPRTPPGAHGTGLARDHGAVALLLGHTADDQAETLLLRIARGTGPDGLAGMRPAAERDGVLVVRPMLGLRRADVLSKERLRRPFTKSVCVTLCDGVPVCESVCLCDLL